MLKILTLCLMLAAMSAHADIVISEISAAHTDRLLRWDANDQPYAGSGSPWWSPGFDDSTWQSGPTPIGFDLGTIATNLRTTMRGITPSLYVRKSIEVSAADASAGSHLILSISCNDGFIVWLNGRELARCNMGAAKAHIYADQIAYRAAGTSTTPIDIDLGAASDALVAGNNTLALQVANSDINSSLRLEMSLAIGASQLSAFGSVVKYLPGLTEPSSDISEPAALSSGPSDWIELHNTGDTTIDLGGWTLSDELAVPGKWRFPDATSIEPGGYLVVLADAPDTPIPGAHFLHANFKLDSGGEPIGLYDDTGAARDVMAPGFPRQYPFHSYGLAPGSGSLAYLGIPSPGRENSGPAFTARVDAPDFDIEGGFYDAAISITLSSQTPGAVIRVTTDGTEPTLATGSEYSAPLDLPVVSNKKGHVIRARAFADGMIPSNTKTNTYLIGQDSRLRSAPALVYSADLPRSLYDPFGPLAIDGGTYVDSQWQAVDKDDYNNVINRGRAYERPIHAEYYFADGSAGFRTDCGVRVAASSYSRPRMTLTALASSPWPAIPVQKPSFNLYFRDEYGNPDVSLPLNGENSPVNRFEQFRVRAGKNDILNPFYIDELVRRMSRDMGQPASTGVINTLYVNAELKGFYNLVERLRTPFFRAYHSDDPNADWDILQFEGNDNIAAGDKLAWNELISRLSAPTNLPNWEAVLEYADPVNIADYFLLNIYMATWDWPHNNWVAARERSTAGRYRLYVWDAEGAMSNKGGRGASTNMIDTYIIGSQAGNSGQTGKLGELRDLWNGLNRWQEFRLIFADRINKHLFNGGVLDDRDFDNSHLKLLNEQLVGEFDELLSFMNGQTVNNSHARNWATGTTRRSYLLGPVRESFRNHDLWPIVTPPVFGRFGGDVEAGYPLNITNETGDIYYTTDGTDPRLPGGLPNPGAISQGGSTLEIDLIAAGSSWRFHDLGEDLGTAWREPGFDDQSWSLGPAPLGYGSISNTSIATPMNTVRNPTAYLRGSFEIDDAPAYTELRIAVHVDGGAVIYINGQEALRDGMPDGVITYGSSSSTDGIEGMFDDFVIDPALLVTGTNTIAVEVHNQTPNSSDMVIDLALEATRTNPDSPPLIIDAPVTVMARSFDGTSWSALTLADFTVESEPASSANLAITEIHYNPAGATAAEIAAGFTDGDQFEFLKIQNLGERAIDLHGVRFTDGIQFDFGTSARRALAPGGRALIVSDLAAFSERYGNSSIIAGQYSGRLNNGGEHIRLIGANGDPLHDFSFATSAPWPDLSGLDGHSIQIIDASAPHGDGSNWTASAEVGGQPGGSAFTAWQIASFVDHQQARPGDDPDGDGLDNFTEFALGTPPLSASNSIPLPAASIESVSGDDYLVLQFTRRPGDRELRFTLQSSDDLSRWSESSIQLGAPITNPDGSITSKLRDEVPLAGARRYLRLKMTSF